MDLKKILPPSAYATLKKLDSPFKIQDFLNRIPFNFEENGDTVYSPLTVLEKNKCHCVEGAVLAALALRLHGYPPLLLDLTADRTDFDHVVAVFREDGYWGAISKTNHSVLRWRDPVYRTIRELVMSYFHEYTHLHERKKTLRSYSLPVNLKRFDRRGWMTTRDEIDYIPEYLAAVRHFPVVSRKQSRNLRQVELIEFKAGNIVEWKYPKKYKYYKA